MMPEDVAETDLKTQADGELSLVLPEVPYFEQKEIHRFYFLTVYSYSNAKISFIRSLNPEYTNKKYKLCISLISK